MCSQRLDKVISFPHGHRGVRRWNWWNRWNFAKFGAAMWDRRVELVGPAVAVMLVEPSLAVPPVPPRSSPKLAKSPAVPPVPPVPPEKRLGKPVNQIANHDEESFGWVPAPSSSIFSSRT